ncbi:Mu transposase C-terminal domain-containing protein [Micromonospora sp. NPDC023888]|uniref:Mu transposase C-terminal domain-containing protein n=1 Tax=Micromonospora sp. NPDC023888 TaxID=3155607 RepID=UPI003411D4BA
MRRLVDLDRAGRLTSAHVKLAASSVGVVERTVWRWLRLARATDQLGATARPRFVVDDQLRRRLAYWRGNVAALHRDLVAQAAEGGPAAPSMATLQRAVARDLPPGARAGLRKGEHAARRFDVFLQRPATYRNAVWETDHVEAPVEVDVDGRLVKPWVTWFVDCASNAVCGTAVTPGPPSRESILTALRAAISLDEPYGPPGGLPEKVRVDRGKDFLSAAVRAALGVFAVGLEDLPGYTPHLKGSVETLNGAAKAMFFAGLPRYTAAPTLTNRRVADPDAPALTFEAFVVALLDWVRWWNTEHRMDALDGRTPLQAWLADPTPLSTVPAQDLRLFTLEDDGRRRKITTKGVEWRRRRYVGAWMTGQVGRTVRVRWMPHHDHEVEVFDATTGEHLGAASLADQASREQIRAVRRARGARKARLEADLRAVEKTRRQRYAAQTTPGPARPVGAVTAAEAQAELDGVGDTELVRVARPRLLPPGPPAPGWVLPRPVQGGGS